MIGFENNRDGYSNIKQQIESLKIALTYLLDHYHFTEFKAVGHSNGGLVLTGLLESGFLEKKKVTVSKLAIIGSPYQFNQEMFEIFKNGSIAWEKKYKSLILSVALLENQMASSLSLVHKQHNLFLRNKPIQK